MHEIAVSGLSAYKRKHFYGEKGLGTQKQSGTGREPDFRGASNSFYCLFHVGRFLKQLFAI